MSTTLPPLGKPSGILLEHHVAHVVAEALAILETMPFVSEKYAHLTGGDLKAHVIAAANDHDLGKCHPRWQQCCREDYNLYRSWRSGKGLDPDLVNASDYRAYEQAIKRKEVPRPANLMRSGIRHEMASLESMKNRSNEAYVAVAAHHGKLAMYFEKRWNSDGLAEGSLQLGPFASHFKKFRQAGDLYSKGKQHERSIADAVRARYRYDVPRALLQLADTRASRMESLGRTALPKIQTWSFKWPDLYCANDGTPSYRPVQRKALELAESDDWVTILRAPTGSGKTAASLLWANRQVQRGRADRLVVAMPTRFTANVLSVSAEELVGEAGLYHSSAFFSRYGNLSVAEKSDAREPHLLAQKLITPVTVCTVDHLLIALTGARERHHSTLSFLAHAAVVFDEADFYDGFVQANLKFLLDALRVLKVPVLIMSATVPESARELYGVSSEITDVDEAEALERTPPIRGVRFGGEVGAPQDARKYLVEMLKDGNGIIYANTVARAMAYRSYLQKLQVELDPEHEIEIVLYHSRFTEPHKKAKEDKLVGLLGADAWKSGRPSAIAILTQIGEMSINVSTTNMLSEACPWDRLSQRIGRLNRFHESDQLVDGRPLAICTVVAPVKDGSVYPAPYGEYKRGDGWEASSPLQETIAHLKSLPKMGIEVTPAEMTTWVNKLYPRPDELTAGSRANIKSYEQLLRASVIVLPNVRIDDDQGEAFDWSARQIGPQTTILTRAAGQFANYGDWQEHKLLYGLEVPVYQIEKDARSQNAQLSKCQVTIGFGEDPDVEIYYYAASGEDSDDLFDILTKEVYNSNLGLFGLYDLGDSEEDLKDDDGY